MYYEATSSSLRGEGLLKRCRLPNSKITTRHPKVFRLKYLATTLFKARCPFIILRFSRWEIKSHKSHLKSHKSRLNKSHLKSHKSHLKSLNFKSQMPITLSRMLKS